MKEKLKKGNYYIADIGTDDMIAAGLGEKFLVRYLGPAHPGAELVPHPRRLPDDSGFILVDVYVPSYTGLTDGHWEKKQTIYEDDIIEPVELSDALKARKDD